MILRFVLLCGAALTLLPTTVYAFLTDSDSGSGTVILAGQAGAPNRLTAKKFVELAGDANARVVLIFAHPVDRDSAASGSGVGSSAVTSEVIECDANAGNPTPSCSAAVKYMHAFGLARFTLVHSDSNAIIANTELTETLKRASGVWVAGGKPNNENAQSSLYIERSVLDELVTFSKRGGVIGADASGGLSLTSSISARPTDGNGGGDVAQERTPQVIPGALIAFEASRPNGQSALAHFVAEHPEVVGVFLEDGAVLLVHDGQFETLGMREVVIVTAGESGELATMRLSWGEQFNVSNRSKTFTPLTTKQRYDMTLGRILRPQMLLSVGISAAIAQGEGSPSQWGNDFNGYAQRYGAISAVVFTRQAMLFGVSSLDHEDPRRYRSDASGLWPRTGIAIKHAFESRRDDGSYGFAYSRFVSDMSSGILASVIYPNTSLNGRSLVDYGVASVGAEMLGSVLFEFSPDIERKLHLQKIRHALSVAGGATFGLIGSR